MDPRTALKDVAREARARLAAMGDSPSAARLGLLLEAGRAERALGEPGAEAALRAALDTAESLRERSAGRLAEIELGALLAARGDPGGRVRIERALEGARRSNAPHEAAIALAELALVHAASGDLAAADAALAAARQEGPASARARVEARAVAVARLRGGAAVPSTRAAHEAVAATTDRLERAVSELTLLEPGAGTVSSAELASLERNDLALLLEATAAVARAGSPAATLVERARSLLAASSVRLEERGQLLAALGEPPDEEPPSLTVRSGERTLALHGTKATPREDLLARALLAHLPDATAPSPARVLAMLDRVLQAGLDLDRLVTVAIDLAVEATGAARGVVLLREPGAKLGFKAARRAGGDLVDPAGVVSRSLVREVFLSGHALRLADAALDPERGTAESVGARGLKSVLVAPIPDEDGSTLGVLYLDDPGTVGRFGPAESGVAVGFAARLGGPLRNVLERSREEASAASTRAALTARPERPKTRHAYPEIVGHGRALGELLALLDRAVDTNAPALISGESGTGKELVARALHANGSRARGPFVALSCAALLDTVLESELFGHVAGAFTGAIETRKGAFERAHGGILFLDELHESSPKLQGILLRVLETGEVRPVGGDTVGKVDVRLVAATNADLGALVAAGSFREDLYYRVNVIHIRVPPLRERLEDIPDLVAHVLAKSGSQRSVTPGALERLLADPWPGNVRALAHAIARAQVLAGDGPVRAEHIVLETPARRRAPAPPRDALYAGSVELNERQLALIERLRVEGEISNAEYSEREAISQPTGWRDLTDLAAKGVLVKSGRGKKTLYRLAPGWEARLSSL